MWVGEHLLFHSSSGSDSVEDLHHLLKIKDMYLAEASEIMVRCLAELEVQTEIAIPGEFIALLFY